jgi:plasmid stabilization system protein ParE
MTLPLIFRPETRDEIDEAYTWYEQRRPGLGEQFLAVLRKHLTRIQDKPEMYAAVYRDVRCSPMRRFPYVVYYRLESQRIVVLAVQHGRRNPWRWKSRA